MADRGQSDVPPPVPTPILRFHVAYSDASHLDGATMVALSSGRRSPMKVARASRHASLVLLTGLLAACSTGPTQPTGGEPPKAAYQTQQLTSYPPFGSVSPGDYQAARQSACRRYCAGFSYTSRRWYLMQGCIRRCMTGGPTDQFAY